MIVNFLLIVLLLFLWLLFYKLLTSIKFGKFIFLANIFIFILYFFILFMKYGVEFHYPLLITSFIHSFLGLGIITSYIMILKLFK